MNVSQLLKLILFADDTNMFICDSDLKSLIVRANNELVLLRYIESYRYRNFLGISKRIDIAIFYKKVLLIFVDFF